MCAGPLDGPRGAGHGVPMRSALAFMALFVVAAAPAVASAEHAAKPRMLVQYNDPGHAAGRWWGLCKTGDDATLQPVNAIVQPPFVVQRDGGTIEQPTLRIAGCDEPIAAFRNLPFLRRRPVPAVSFAHETHGDTTRYSADFAGQHVLLESHATDDGAGCALQLGPPPSTPQPLSEAGCELVWLGDLDGDGRTDLLIDTTVGNYAARQLFLSSAAKAGERVHALVFTYIDPN
jgi:hypothetical protein